MRDAIAGGLLLMLFSAGSALAAPPVATDDSMTAMTGSSDNVMVLANDTDPDGDSLQLVSHTDSIEGVVVTCDAEGLCTYGPYDGPCPMTDSFTYEVSDGTETDTATVTVNVECSEEPPPGEGFVHERKVTLELHKHLVASGSISLADQGVPPLTECKQDANVKILQRKAGGWRVVKTTTTDMAGDYKVRLKDKRGKYRAKASSFTAQNGDTCAAATSPRRTHRH